MGNLRDIWNNMTSTDKWLGIIAVILLVIGVISSTGLFDCLISTETVKSVSLISFTLSFALFLMQLILGNIAVKFSAEKMEINYTQMKMEIDRFVKDYGALGKLKEITEAQIWDLDGDIYGFNPNWDLELKTNFYGVYDAIRDIHYKRLVNPNVKAIEYIFLEDYEHNGMFFGSKYFLKFLDDLKINHSLIDSHVNKYIVWRIPKDKWNNDENIKKIIAPFKDLIFIRGTRFNKQRVILFFNNNTSIINGTHNYYLELYGDNYFTQALIDMFETLKGTLCEDACKCPYPISATSGTVECSGKTLECEEVHWDDTTKSYNLRKRKK